MIVDRVGVRLDGLKAVVLLAGLAGFGLAQAAANVAIDNILVSKTSGVTNVQIWPGCRMRYVDHTPVVAGLELRIRVRTDGECAELLEGVSTEVYLPLGRRLAGVSEVRFDALGNGDTFITLQFDSPQQFDVRQHTIGWIEVFVDTTVDTDVLPADVPPPLDLEPEVAEPPPALVREAERPSAPARRWSPTRRQVAPSRTGEFVVQLGVFESIDRAVAENTSLVLEGISIVPGLIDPYAYSDVADVRFLVVATLDADAYRVAAEES